MAKVTNISGGPRGAYHEGQLVMAEPGQTIDADDHCDEWFAAANSKAAKHAEDDGISSMKKADLVAICEAEGVAFETGDNRSDLISKIEAARAAA